MQVLRLEDDLSKLAVDDVLGRKLQDAGLDSQTESPKEVVEESATKFLLLQ